MHEGTSKKVPEYWGKGHEKKRKKFSFDKKPSKTEKDKEEIKRLQKEYEKYDPSKATAFKKMPLSWKTLSALKMSGFLTPTEIQRESIGLALRGLDILGAAKTGSGKTLAFLIPILEALNSKLWTKLDGLGALIITPTRELAYQIFEALKKVGAKHDFSAGLIIGGKDLKFERKRMDQLNIVICTPGRLLQHMDENPNFDCSNLQILVLDEADRCLDMGFETTMNAIIANLPKERQTLLFSATQTKSVRDLARLSLKSPVYVSVHENAQYSTPESLQQSYVVCPLEMKLDMLWSFLRHHKKAKILVFLSSCKQVRFVHMLFCRMRPGTSLLALYGTMHQLKRMAVYEEFCSKQSVVLFATDIASRGLDFPAVDWVLQLDCPEDATTYIHRAGRTARFNKDGEALLVLLPSEEEAMITELTEKKIPIEKIDVNNKKMTSVKRKFEALLARDVTLKECAQRAFKAYLKSYFMMKNKKVFDVNQLELTSFAGSLGLAVAPRVRFLQKRLKKCSKPDTNAPKAENESQSEEESQEEDGESDTEVVVQNLKSEATGSYDFDIDGDDDNVDDLFVGKKEVVLEDDNEIDVAAKKLLDGMNPGQKKNKVKSKIAIAKKALKKNMVPNKKIVFDEEGGTVTDIRRERQSEMAKEYENENAGGIDIEKAKQILKLEDQVDKKIHRERIKAKHKEKKKKAKLAQKGEEEEVDTFDATAEMDGGASDDGDEPDLSWLPDPDKVYGESDGANDEDVEEDAVASNNSDEEETVPVLGKRKARQVLDPDDSDAEYAGLIVNTSDESDSDDNPKTIRHKMMQLSKSKNNKNAKRKKLDKLDKTAMEEIALQLLKQ